MKFILIRNALVTNFMRANSGTAITLMTPEPTGDFYKERGVATVVNARGRVAVNRPPSRSSRKVVSVFK